MTHVIVNLEKIEDYVNSLILDENLSQWLSKALKKEAVTRLDWLVPSFILESDDEYVRKAIKYGETIFEIVFSDEMKEEIKFVVDWLVGLDQRDPRLFAKLDRITWKQAIEHSKRWHEQLARAAEKSKYGFIEFDENCPVMFTHDDGMKWVWLKTHKSRDDEGCVMGHCVGGAWYDDLDHNSGVFSLRDSFGKPHVTLEFNMGEIIQAKMRGNADVSEKYQLHVDEFHAFMFPKFTMKVSKSYSGVVLCWNGDEEYYENGVLHREDGPAVIGVNGSEFWFRHGKPHRENDPAFVYLNGEKTWYFEGNKHRDGGPAHITKDGSKHWYQHGNRHRSDGPAIERSSGGREWWIDGKRHRDDGPAIIKSYGVQEWWVDGERHREDGPAIEYSENLKDWYFHGINYSKEDYDEIVALEKSLSSENPS